ncbi:hypothetical protein KTT_54610 [Tengunoibacter tsumagoiensis]|uniref:Uncharacterized protein n=1 Tax=Tengunoibacter tsumagoiensis TaxID=2014871 RepID=A0A402A8X0_9CHLR|nr:hypothetical protein KTT_54610 [Tengunoibacter tsumagoiensis]
MQLWTLDHLSQRGMVCEEPNENKKGSVHPNLSVQFSDSDALTPKILLCGW